MSRIRLENTSGSRVGVILCRATVLTPGPGWELLDKLESDSALTGIQSAKEGLADMRKLFEYLEVFGVLDKVRQRLLRGMMATDPSAQL